MLFDYVHPIHAAIIITINSIELWHIRKTKKQSGNRMLIFMQNLSIADFLVGVLIALTNLSRTIEKHYFQSNRIMEEISNCLRLCILPCSMCASLLIVIVFTIVKMRIVTKNEEFTQSNIHNICKITWGASSLLIIPEYILFRVGLFPKKAVKYSKLIFPVLTCATICVFISTLTRMSTHIKKSSDRLIKQKSKSIGSFLTPQKPKNKSNLTKITGMSLIIFAICWLPISTYSVVFLITKTNVERHQDITSIFRGLAIWNSVFNAMIYFVVYRPAYSRKVNPAKARRLQIDNRESYLTSGGLRLSPLQEKKDQEEATFTRRETTHIFENVVTPAEMHHATVNVTQVEHKIRVHSVVDNEGMDRIIRIDETSINTIAYCTGNSEVVEDEENDALKVKRANYQQKSWSI